MPEQEVISPRQAASLLLGFLIGTSIIFAMGVPARQDAWLATLLGGSSGFLVLGAVVALAHLFPGESPISYTKRLLGPWVGGLVGLLFLWYGLHLGTLTLRNYGDFVVTTMLAETPFVVPLIILMAVAAYGVRHGLEVVARSSLIITPLVVTQIVVVSVLLIQNMRPAQLLPVAENGLLPILTGALQVFSFPYGESILFAQILPHVAVTRRPARSVFQAMAGGILLFVFMAARNVSVAGSHLAETDRSPSLTVVQYIDLADFINRLDAVIISGWLAVGFLKFAVCLFVVSKGLADWLGVGDYRPLVLPLGGAMVALATMLYKNTSEQAKFALEIWPVYSLLFQLLLPLLLLSVALLRNRLRDKGVVGE